MALGRGRRRAGRRSRAGRRPAPRTRRTRLRRTRASSRAARDRRAARRGGGGPVRLDDVALPVDVERDLHAARTTRRRPAHVKRSRIAAVRNALLLPRRARPASRSRAAAARPTTAEPRPRRDHRDDRRRDGADGCTERRRRRRRARTAARRRRRSGSTRRRPTSSSFETNCGTFTVTLDLEQAPATAARSSRSREAGFFDDTIFHRIVPGFVIQGGDPTQSGSGRARATRRSTRRRPTPRTSKGVVAMAKTERRARRDVGEPVLRRHRRRRRPAAGLRDRRHGDERPRRRRADRRARRSRRPSSRPSPS